MENTAQRYFVWGALRYRYDGPTMHSHMMVAHILLLHQDGELLPAIYDH